MLNPSEEAKFAELKDKCRELKVQPPPEIMIGLQVHDKNGVLTFSDIQRGHSWTRNFYNMLFAVATDSPGSNSNNFGAGYETGKATTGTIYYDNTRQWSRFSNIILGSGYIRNLSDATFGLLVGTSDTAFSVEQYAIQSLIAHGNSTGQFAYTAMGNPVITYGSKTWTCSVSRIVNNNSGASITVKECALYWNGYSHTPTSGLFFMFERSVLDPTVAVANGAQLTVTYEISMDFSAID